MGGSKQPDTLIPDEEELVELAELLVILGICFVTWFCRAEVNERVRNLSASTTVYIA